MLSFLGILFFHIFHSWHRLPLPSVILRPKIAFLIFYFSSKVYVHPWTLLMIHFQSMAFAFSEENRLDKNMLSHFCPVCPKYKIHGRDIWVTPKFPCIAVSCCITKLFQTAAQWGWLRFISSYWKIGALRNTTASSCMLELINGQNIVESLRSSSSSKGQNTWVRHLSHPKKNPCSAASCCITKLFQTGAPSWGYLRFIPCYWIILL